MSQTCLIEQSIIQSIDFWMTNFQFEKTLKLVPLLITGDIASGKSALIAKWLQYQKTYHPKDSFLKLYDNPSLTSTPSCNESLFNLLTKLRQEYNLPLRTSILEEKLRMSFIKFLELSTTFQARKSILIIIDGVDLFKEANGKEASAEWLPSVLPENVKIIYTCNTNSEAESVLAPKCKVISIPSLSVDTRKKVLKEFLKKYPDMKKSENVPLVKRFIKENSSAGNPLFLKLFITWSLSCFPGIAKFMIPTAKEIPDIGALFMYSIRFFSPYCSNSIKKVLGCLCLCKYSLTREEISLSAGISIKLASKILAIYEVCFIKFDDLYCFTNHVFRTTLYCEVPTSLAAEMSLTIEEQNSVKRVNELLHALCLSFNWKHLKDKIRDIHVFSYLYSQNFKLHLCRYWLELEKNGFDPVEEYNKCIEDLFFNNPAFRTEDVVLVLLNFFSFFQEYGEIECPKIAAFRNYPLTNKETLQDVNLFAEIEKNDDIFNENPISSLQPNERFLIEEVKQELLRESSKELETEHKKKLNATPYHYKRWLWINFPWVALCPTINASVYLSMFKSTSGEISYQKEKELNENLLKILAPSNTSANSIKIRPQTTKPLQRRSSSSQLLTRKLGLQSTTLTHADTASGAVSINNSMSSKTMHIYSEETTKPETYFINFSLRDTGINNVLLKLDSQLVKFSEKEYKKQHKETLKLQQQYNKLIEMQRIKVREIQNITTQLSQLEARNREKEEVVRKLNLLHYHTNKNLEKLVIEQAEGDYLVKIQKSCTMNPPFRKEWNNDIISAIDAINTFVKAEEVQIEAYQQDMLEYQARTQALKPLLNEKRFVETTTLSKLSEKYSLNAYINKNVVKGFNRRKMMILMPEPKENSLMLNSKIKKKQPSNAKISIAKSYLEQKVSYHEGLFRKLIEASKDKETLDLNGIIAKFQNQADLRQQKKEIEKGLNELKLEKTHLEEQLNYLSVHKPPPVEEEVHQDFHELSDRLDCTLIKILSLQEKVTDQEFKIIKLKEILVQLFKSLKTPEPCEFSKPNIPRIFKFLGDSVISLQHKAPSAPPENSKSSKALLFETLVKKTLTVNKSFDALSLHSAKPSSRNASFFL